MVATSSTLDSLQAIGLSVGYIRDVHSEPTDFDCPVHQVPVRRYSLDSINGWQAATVCPDADGTCCYPADGPTVDVDPPTGKPKTVEADTGGF